jgi:hypothetical protein
MIELFLFLLFLFSFFTWLYFFAYNKGYSDAQRRTFKWQRK